MSNELLSNTTRRGFLGTATAATALTLTTPPAAEAQANKTQMAQLTAASPPQPAATSTRAQTPANYGFTIIAKVKPGREQTIRAYGKKIENAIAESPSALAPLKLHYLRWVLFNIAVETYFMYQGIFDTDFDKYTEDAVALFTSLGVDTTFENLEGFPMDWKTNTPAFVKFVRDHHYPSFLEYGEYPYVTADEVKKALRVKSALSSMLDQMQ